MPIATLHNWQGIFLGVLNYYSFFWCVLTYMWQQGTCTLHTNIVPRYLCDTIANLGKNSQYNTRNEEKYIIPKRRLDIYKKSFIPDAICKWNVLPNDVIKSTLGQFRRGISNFAKDSSAPMYFNFWKRMLNIIHTKLRHKLYLTLRFV